MNTEILRVLIPIGTFLLGCGFTLLLRRMQDRKQVLQSSIRELSRLTNEWYNQIHAYPGSLKNLLQTQNLDPETGSSMYAYIHNRLILPDLLLHLAVIRQHPDCKELVEKVVEFLNTVTEPRALTNPVMPKTGGWKEALRLARAVSEVEARQCVVFNSYIGGRNELLEKLDKIVQSIALESGRLMK